MNKRVFEFPVLVTPRDNSGYGIRPLLFAAEPVWHKRYPRAQALFHRQLIRRHNETPTARDSIDTLLWLNFSPSYTYRLMQFDVKQGKQVRSMHMGVVFITLHDQLYALMPLLSHTGLAIEHKLKERDAVYEACHRHVTRFFKNRRKRHDGEDWTPYQSSGKDFCAPFDVALDIKPGPIKFTEPWWSLFATFSKHKKFDGAKELRKIGYDLLDNYPDALMTAYYRESLSERLCELLFFREPGCVCVVGPPGCGKTALIHDALRHYIKGDDFRKQHSKQKIWHIDPLRIITGMSVIGMWERRVEAVIDYVIKRKRRQRSDVIYTDNPVALFRIGKTRQSQLTVADILKPYLQQRAFSMLLETTPQQWDKIQEIDRRFADLFHVVRVDEPGDTLAAKMLARRLAEIERRESVAILPDAILQLWQLLRRHPTVRGMPGVACDALQQLAANQDEIVNAAEVRRFFSLSHHFNEALLDNNVLLRDDDLSAYLDHRLIGQGRAKNCLMDIIHTVKAGVNDSSKPMASVLFIGPTGVGKTEAAKILSAFMFGSARHMVRIDMNEYVDSDAVARLVGDIDHPVGQLTAEVRFKKACVLLLDEIEKAHPDVHNVLLQLLGEARLTDAMGETTDFSQTVVVMTSNLGADQVNRLTGFTRGHHDREQTYREATRRFFRPEFINRIDDIVVFDSLDKQHIQQISTLLLQKMLRREGLQRRTTFLHVSKAALTKVAADAFEPRMGARALKRNLEKTMVTMIATELARISVDQPIILSIDLSQGKLAVSLQAIVFHAQQTCHLPAVDHGALIPAYHTLGEYCSKGIERLHHGVDQFPDRRMQLWAVGEGLKELKRQIDKVLWDMETFREKPVSGGSFKLKTSKSYDDWRLLSAGTHWQTLLRTDLDEYRIRQQSQPLQERVHGAYLMHFLNARFQCAMVDAAVTHAPDSVHVTLTSLVDSLGDEALQLILQQYLQILQALGASVTLDDHQETPEFNRIGFQAQAPGIADVLRHEQGLHIVLDDDHTQFPVQLTVGDNKHHEPGHVIRFYKRGMHGKLVLDLRTGLVCMRIPKDAEWLMFLSATQQE